MNDTTMRATGRIVDAATNTAAFVRAQLANGVSLETLRRQLRIRPEHMLEMLAHAPEPPLPKPVLAKKPQHLPTAGWGAVRPAAPQPLAQIENRGGAVDAMKAKAAAAREKASDIAIPILAIIREMTGLSVERLTSKSMTGADKKARAMFFGLANELRPDIPVAAWGERIGRSSSSAHDGVFICGRLRRRDRDFERQYLRALSRLAP